MRRAGNMGDNRMRVKARIKAEKNCYEVEFEILTAVTMKSTVFWVVTSCSSIELDLRGTCRLHLQGRRVNPARNYRKQTASYLNISLPTFL
jgi:hypothetical protein